MICQWTTIKPEFKEDCLLVTACKIGDEYDYAIWEIKEVDWGDGPYMAWLTDDGEECGNLADLTADKYLILPKVD